MPKTKIKPLKPLKLCKISAPEPVAALIGFKKDIDEVHNFSTYYNVSEAIVLKSLLSTAEASVLDQAIKYYREPRH